MPPQLPFFLRDACWQRQPHGHDLLREGRLLGSIALDRPEAWDGIYRWQVQAPKQHGLASSLRQARDAIYTVLDTGAVQEGLFALEVKRRTRLFPLPAWAAQPRLTARQAEWLAHATPEQAAAFLVRGPVHSRQRHGHGHEEFLPCLRGVVVGSPQATADEARQIATTVLSAHQQLLTKHPFSLDEEALGLVDHEFAVTRRLAELGASIDRLLHLGPLLAGAGQSLAAMDAAIEELTHFNPTRENLLALTAAIPFPRVLLRVVSKRPQRWLLDNALELGLFGYLGRAQAPPPKRILRQRAAIDPPPMTRWFYADTATALGMQAIAWIEREHELEAAGD